VAAAELSPEAGSTPSDLATSAASTSDGSASGAAAGGAAPGEEEAAGRFIALRNRGGSVRSLHATCPSPLLVGAWWRFDLTCGRVVREGGRKQAARDRSPGRPDPRVGPLLAVPWRSDLRRPAAPWTVPRLVYLQHASDPIVWWSPELLVRKPDRPWG